MRDAAGAGDVTNVQITRVQIAVLNSDFAEAGVSFPT